MNSRPQLVSDLALHLCDDLEAVVLRHTKLAKGGGVSDVEWTATVLIVAETILAQAVGVALTITEPDQRVPMFDLTAQKILRHLYDRRNEVIAAAGVAAKATGR